MFRKNYILYLSDLRDLLDYIIVKSTTKLKSVGVHLSERCTKLMKKSEAIEPVSKLKNDTDQPGDMA